MLGHPLVFYFQLASLLGSALVAGKLFHTGLHHRYQFFFLYFIFRVFNGIWPILLDFRSQLYLKFWVITSPMTWAFYFVVVLELYRLVLEKHKGLYTLGRWAMYFGMTVSVGLSVLTLFLRIKPAQRSKVLSYFFPIDRGVTLCLVIFLLLMLFLISRYPVRLSHNVILHSTLYTVFFLSSALGVILSDVFGLQNYGNVNLATTIVSCACVYCWLFFLSPKGEEVKVNLPHLGPEHEERLLQQLDSLNETLLKVARK